MLTVRLVTRITTESILRFYDTASLYLSLSLSLAQLFNITRNSHIFEGCTWIEIEYIGKHVYLCVCVCVPVTVVSGSSGERREDFRAVRGDTQ